MIRDTSMYVAPPEKEKKQKVAPPEKEKKQKVSRINCWHASMEFLADTLYHKIIEHAIKKIKWNDWNMHLYMNKRAPRTAFFITFLLFNFIGSKAFSFKCASLLVHENSSSLHVMFIVEKHQGPFFIFIFLRSSYIYI